MTVQIADEEKIEQFMRKLKDKDFLENAKNELEENGLFVEQTGQSIKNYSPFDTLKAALFEDSSNDFSTVLNKLLGITPRTTINPKLASSFAC